MKDRHVYGPLLLGYDLFLFMIRFANSCVRLYTVVNVRVCLLLLLGFREYLISFELSNKIA